MLEESIWENFPVIGLGKMQQIGHIEEKKNDTIKLNFKS